MKKLFLMLAAAFTLLAMAAPAADAQIYFGPGYYGPRYFGPGYYGPRFYGGPYYRRAVYFGGPRYFYGPRRWYGPRFIGVYPAYRPYAGCLRWRLVPTAIGPQWRMVNVCYAPAYVGPIYPYRRAFYY
jgi:hypothetical protein